MEDAKKLIHSKAVKDLIHGLNPKALVEGQWLAQLGDFIQRVITANVTHEKNKTFIRHFIAGTQDKGDIKDVTDVSEDKRPIISMKPVGKAIASISVPYRVTFKGGKEIIGSLPLRTGYTGKELHVIAERRLYEMLGQIAGLEGIVTIKILKG